MGPCRLLLFRLWFLRGERDCGRTALAPRMKSRGAGGDGGRFRRSICVWGGLRDASKVCYSVRQSLTGQVTLLIPLPTVS